MRLPTPSHGKAHSATWRHHLPLFKKWPPHFSWLPHLPLCPSPKAEAAGDSPGLFLFIGELIYAPTQTILMTYLTHGSQGVSSGLSLSHCLCLLHPGDSPSYGFPELTLPLCLHHRQGDLKAEPLSSCSTYPQWVLFQYSVWEIMEIAIRWASGLLPGPCHLIPRTPR